MPVLICTYGVGMKTGGVDYIKLDADGSTRAAWGKVRQAIDHCPRPMYLQVAFCRSVEACEGWIDTLANAWRTSGDAQATWRSVMNNVDLTEPLWPLQHPPCSPGGAKSTAGKAIMALQPAPCLTGGAQRHCGRSKTPIFPKLFSR